MHPPHLLSQALDALELTPSPLGDRSTYVGSSDVGHCPRRVVREKRAATPLDTTARLRQMRGHVAEELIGRLFSLSGHSYISQLELVHPMAPFQAHVDFLFTDTPNALHIVEVKTVNGLPKEPFSSWLDQLQWQLGLFRLQYPGQEVCGHLLALDLNSGQVASFGPFEPCEEIFAYLQDRGHRIMAALADGGGP